MSAYVPHEVCDQVRRLRNAEHLTDAQIMELAAQFQSLKMAGARFEKTIPAEQKKAS